MALALHNGLKSQFAYEWAVRDSLDERPFGTASTMLVMSGIYLVSLTLIRLAVGPEGCAGKTLKVVKAVEGVNNLVMAIYSFYTFLGIAALLWHNWKNTLSMDPVAPFCDPDRRMLKEMDFWMYTFYVSKYWEWVDTWILIMKGKKVWPPSTSQYFLHVFHHTTTASIAWLAWRQEFTIAWIGPLTNSFVHTPMYAYYFLSTITHGVRRFGIFITPIQILQFIMCLMSIVPEALGALTGSPIVCSSATARTICWLSFTYSVFLFLFVKMFSQKKKGRSKENAKKE